MGSDAKIIAGCEPDAVIDRLRSAYGVPRDADLVRVLGLAAGAVANWRNRGTVPFAHCVSAAVSRGVSLDWLLLGREGAMARDGLDTVAEDAAGYVAGREQGDDRLPALTDWLVRWWATASEEERGWLVVELRMLRGRLRGEG